MKLVVERGERADEVLVERDGELWRVTVREVEYLVDAAALGDTARSLGIDGRQFEIDVVARGGGRYEVSRGSWLEELTVQDPLAYLASLAHGTATATATAAATVTAYMPGRVAAVLVEEGARVEAGAGVVVLEAMKMENEIPAERGGVVRRIFVSLGQAVEGGDPLFELE